MRYHPQILLALAIAGATLATTATSHAQILETESARLLPRGRLEIGTGFEFQTSSEGTERAVPIAMEWGVTNRLSLLVEPIVYAAIRPDRGPRATGPGDLEVTALGLVAPEGMSAPAIALGLEVKIPTAKNVLIGTGETDVTGYLIASKRFGAVDTHANLGYAVIGQPPRTKLNNIWSGAFAAEYAFRPTVLFYGEVLGNSAASPEGGDSNLPNVLVPEAAGGELVGTVGVGVRPARSWMLSFGVSVDNNSAVQVRPGITVWIH